MSPIREPFWTRLKREELYPKWGPRAEGIKIVLQFLTGFGLALLLASKAFHSVVPQFFSGWFPHRVQELISLPPLELVARALAFSAGFELAYTLFTPGPDEAVEPVIMGLAAAMLFGFSKLEQITFPAGCGAVAFVIALGGLFLVRHYFVPPKDEERKNHAQPEGDDQAT